jgi:hypothetical protein
MADDLYLTNRGSSWDPKVLSTSSEVTRVPQNRYSVQLSPSNYLIPKARNTSQVHPQYNVDERQVQQYQQPKQQPTQTNTSNPR